MTRLQQIADATPKWLDAIIIVGSAALAWIQALAGVVAIVWGCLQIYGWFEKRWRNRDRSQG